MNGLSLARLPKFGEQVSAHSPKCVSVNWIFGENVPSVFSPSSKNSSAFFAPSLSSLLRITFCSTSDSGFFRRSVERLKFILSVYFRKSFKITFAKTNLLSVASKLWLKILIGEIHNSTTTNCFCLKESNWPTMKQQLVDKNLF